MSEYFIANLSMMPVRREPVHRSEMVSMLLLGDLCLILESAADHWYRIRTIHDEYEGWIYSRNLHLLNDDEYSAYSSEDPVYAATAIDNCKGSAGFTRIEFGCRLPEFRDKTFSLSGQQFEYQGDVISPTGMITPEQILRVALQYLGTPYLWGGRSIFGIDCSGFTQMVYRLNGIALRRDAWQQEEQGKPVAELQNAMPGDLAFFAEKEKISHVGIITGDGRIIHASEYVRIDKIDENGILNPHLKAYSLKAVSIKRYMVE